MKSDVREFANQPLKSSMLAFVLSTIFVLALALVAKMFTLADDMLPIINQVLKGLSVAIGCIACIHHDKLIPKALLTAILYSVLNCILFVCLGGQFDFGTIMLDLGIALAIAMIICIIKARKN